MAELAAAVSTLQVELVGVKARLGEREAANESLRETIVNLTQESQLLKRRIYGNKTERTNTSELQLSLGELVGCWAHCRRKFFEAAWRAARHR